MWSLLLIGAIIFIILLMSGVFFYFLRFLFQEEKEKRDLEYRLKTSSEITPIRLQAYERIALYLERIRPTSLVRRIEAVDGFKNYESLLLRNIQEEFDHNLSQQIYINPETWKIIFSSKNATQNFIRECALEHNEGSTQEFIELIIKKSINENIPSSQAMIYLQKDIQGGL